MKSLKLAAFVAMTAAGLAGAPTARADCKMFQIAEFHVDPTSAVPIVDGEINGQPVKILFDTGSASSMLMVHDARRLKLPLDRLAGARAYGVGGDTAMYQTTIKELVIDKTTERNFNLVVAGDPDVTSRVAMILGDDFFSQVDVEFDLADSVVRLFKPKGCSPPQLIYWGATYSQAKILPWDVTDPTTQSMALLNGKLVLAELDTGSHISMVDEATAASVGGMRLAAGAAIHGLGPRSVDSWTARFDSFALGDEKMANVHLQTLNLTGDWNYSETGALIPRPLESRPAMLIGADFFHAHRVYFDNRDHLVLFSYQGGPVFRQAVKDAAGG
jgi:hypothetical protein